MAGQFYAGYTGSVTIGESTYKVTSWSVVLTTQLLKFTNSDSGGQQEYETGVQDGEFSVMFNFEVGTTPGDELMQYGGTKTPITLALGGTGPTIAGTGAVSEFRVMNEVEGLVPCSLAGKFTGGYDLTDF